MSILGLFVDAEAVAGITYSLVTLLATLNENLLVMCASDLPIKTYTTNAKRILHKYVSIPCFQANIPFYVFSVKG